MHTASELLGLGSFQFRPGTTPMGTLKESAIGIAVYYVAVFGGAELMKNRKPYDLKFAFKLHNLFLTVGSAGLLGLFLKEIVPTVREQGIYDSVCRKDAGWTQPLLALYYINYLFKYLEFVDTMFLVLKKKPLTFLCYTQLVGQTPVSWVPIVLNLGVHTIMYWYYFQIFIYFTTYNIFVKDFFPNAPVYGYCEGGGVAASTGCAILTSYLFLFIGFYIASYKGPGKAPRKPVAKPEPTSYPKKGLAKGWSSTLDPLLQNGGEMVKLARLDTIGEV
ncbi:putative fatty acid elongase protein [Neofusicoccum parvum UCRNP2]|uniref:Elongation of fatty acids protein n=1 Tax=Botryosphaeria parva (strain UCR-NP2) TaxID=1287680 RepID=R1EYF7_BOTPV|nr:putative fatty acid elongase protein [Neofusicoccum parvum UCRNP2]